MTILPDQPGFAIFHEFQNTGSRPIHRYVYCHNWLRIDGRSPHAGTVLRFAKTIEGDGRDHPQAQVQADEIRFTDELSQPEPRPFYIKLPGRWTAADNEFRLVCADTEAACQVRGDWSPAFVDIYADATAVCPEPHFELDLAPGKSATWTTTYRFCPPAD
ncbi:MAG: hypothetical protein ACLFUJ_15750 [Phycisphaerae bacterium]